MDSKPTFGETLAYVVRVSVAGREFDISGESEGKNQSDLWDDAWKQIVEEKLTYNLRH